jgi:hypothetical protein
MRKTQGPGHVSADRIVLSAGHKGPSRPAAPKARTLRPSPEIRKIAARSTPRSGATMDYQMGFSSGSSI